MPLAKDLSPNTHTGRLAAYLPDLGTQHPLLDSVGLVLRCTNSHVDINIYT